MSSSFLIRQAHFSRSGTTEIVRTSCEKLPTAANETANEMSVLLGRELVADFVLSLLRYDSKLTANLGLESVFHYGKQIRNTSSCH